MTPQPGEIWLIETCCLTAERVLVHGKSLFWSWLLRKPQYWVNQDNGWFKWLEDGDAFLSRKHSWNES